MNIFVILLSSFRVYIACLNLLHQQIEPLDIGNFFLFAEPGGFKTQTRFFQKGSLNFLYIYFLYIYYVYFLLKSRAVNYIHLYDDQGWKINEERPRWLFRLIAPRLFAILSIYTTRRISIIRNSSTVLMWKWSLPVVLIRTTGAMQWKPKASWRQRGQSFLMSLVIALVRLDMVPSFHIKVPFTWEKILWRPCLFKTRSTRHATVDNGEFNDLQTKSICCQSQLIETPCIFVVTKQPS